MIVVDPIGYSQGPEYCATEKKKGKSAHCLCLGMRLTWKNKNENLMTRLRKYEIKHEYLRIYLQFSILWGLAVNIMLNSRMRSIGKHFCFVHLKIKTYELNSKHISIKVYSLSWNWWDFSEFLHLILYQDCLLCFVSDQM